MKKQIIKPSKTVSKLSFFIGIIFSIFGLGMIITSIVSPISFIPMGIFFIVWTAIAVFNTYTAYKNGFTEEYISMYDINSYEDDNKEIDFEEKIRKLERLKMDGLISEDEYNQKRKEIMSKEW